MICFAILNYLYYIIFLWTADIESEDNTYDENDWETNTFDISMDFEDSKSSRFTEKKRKQMINAYGVRSCEVRSDILQLQYAENKVVTQQSSLLAKRPGGSLNVSIPTKRVRTASRRVISPFGAGTSGCIQVPNKNDASSGDTNSFQDDQSTLHGGSFVPHSLEVDSVGDFEKQLPFDSAEVSTKHKKKKKAKHLVCNRIQFNYIYINYCALVQFSFALVFIAECCI